MIVKLLAISIITLSSLKHSRLFFLYFYDGHIIRVIKISSRL